MINKEFNCDCDAIKFRLPINCLDILTRVWPTRVRCSLGSAKTLCIVWCSSQAKTARAFSLSARMHIIHLPSLAVWPSMTSVTV